MADEREGTGAPPPSPADRDTIQSGGREANAARPLNAAPDEGGPERYPAVDQSDAVERTSRPGAPADEPRSFDPSADAPTPREGPADGGAPAGDGRLGPAGDPAEGKR